MTTGCGDRSLRQLHAEGTFELLIEEIEHVVVLPFAFLPLFLLLLVDGRRSTAADQRLPSPRLLPLGQRGIGLDRPDGSDQVTGGAGQGGDGGGVRGGGRRGAVGALPIGDGGECLRRAGKA